MRAFDTATAAAMAAGDVDLHLLLWLQGKSRTTGLTETIGLWTGDDVAQFTVDGEVRTYYGCGAALDCDPIVMEPGYSVRSQRVRLGGLNEAVVQALRVYDPRFAPAQLHRAVFNVQTGVLVAPPHRLFIGTVDEVSLPLPEKGGSVEAELSVASSALAGTRPLTVRKSDEAQQAAHPGDRFRRYVAISNAVPVWWGELRAGQSGLEYGREVLRDRFGGGQS